MTDYIWITTEKEFIHYYPDAPEEVKFLRNEHRHIFKFKIYIGVTHDIDRDVEFIMCKRFVDKVLDGYEKSGTFSCEQLADALYFDIAIKYPMKPVKIEVSEDGENGCLKEYD